MAKNTEVILALREILRNKRITYATLAKQLGLSESSLKRNFSHQDMSLSRLGQICELASIEFADIINHIENNRQRFSQFTKEQEIALAKDIKLLMMAYFLSVGMKFEDILSDYDITEAEGIALLTQLDRIGILELLPGNRVRVLFDRNFSWHPRGPIARFFEKYIQAEFFNTTFENSDDLRVVCNGNLTQASLEECQDKLNRVKREIDLLIDKEAKIPHHLKHGVTMIAAVRPWRLSVFQHLKKNKLS